MSATPLPSPLLRYLSPLLRYLSPLLDSLTGKGVTNFRNFAFFTSATSGVAMGGKATCPPPPPTSDRTPCEMDADSRRFSCPKKWGLGLQDLLRRFTCTDNMADVLSSYGYEKKRELEFVEGVTLVGSQ